MGVLSLRLKGCKWKVPEARAASGPMSAVCGDHSHCIRAKVVRGGCWKGGGRKKAQAMVTTETKATSNIRCILMSAVLTIRTQCVVCAFWQIPHFADHVSQSIWVVSKG